MKKKLFISLILVCVIVSISSIVIYAETISKNTLQNYLSQSRVISEDRIGYGYDDYSYYISSENNYLYKINKTTYEKYLVCQKEFSEVYEHKNHIYCVDDNKIVSISPNGVYEKLVFNGNHPIRNLFVDDYAMYFIMDNTIYRFFVNESKLDALITHDNLYTFIPVSNQVMEWNYLTDEWLDYLNTTQDTSNSLGIKTTVTQSTNLITKESVEIPDFSKYIALTNALVSVPENMTRSSSYTINGHSIPQQLYPNGSFYSFNANGCECHATCGATIGECDCRYAYNKSSTLAKQCHGFGCYIYRYIWDLTETEQFPASRAQNPITFSSNIYMTKELAEGYIETNLGPGSLIRFNTRSGSQHTIIIVDYNVTAVINGVVNNNCLVVYHGNAGGTSNCQVKLDYFTYDYIAETYSGIHHAYN